MAMKHDKHDPVSACIPGHGTYSCQPETLDLMIARHLPASPLSLRGRVAEECGWEESHFDDVRNVCELLIMLADFYEGRR